MQNMCVNTTSFLHFLWSLEITGVFILSFSVFISSFIPLFNHQIVDLFIRSIIKSQVLSINNLPRHSFLHSFIQSSSFPLIHSFTHLFVCFHPITSSFIHPFIHLFIPHSATYLEYNVFGEVKVDHPTHGLDHPVRSPVEDEAQETNRKHNKCPGHDLPWSLCPIANDFLQHIVM